MRLLEVLQNGDFRLTRMLLDDKIPQYAILSHTWGDEGQEVTFEDIVKGSGRDKAGYEKIRFSSRQAAQDDLQYFWIDSCCIDKSSSTELQEAINSMFRWYQEAAKCYVYLSDITTKQKSSDWESSFHASRWFTRGWTLQELLAPNSVEFFSQDGERFGDKKTLESQIHEITSIPIQALQGIPLSSFSIDERFSWALNRQTTRKEDGAYCLLGLFDIHMSLIYGEGRDKAFRRLKNKIEKASAIAASPYHVQSVLVHSDKLQGLPHRTFPDRQASFLTRVPTLEGNSHITQHPVAFEHQLSIHRQSLNSVKLSAGQTQNATSAEAIPLASVAWPWPQSECSCHFFENQNPLTKNGAGNNDETYERRVSVDESSVITQSKLIEKFCDKCAEQLAEPITVLEASGSFRPETFTNLEATPMFFSYSECQGPSTEYTQNSQYAMFYSRSPRHWMRLTLSVTTSIESRYWNLLPAPQFRDTLNQCSFGLPTHLSSMIERVLRNRVDFKQDSHLSLYLGAGPAKTTLRVSTSRFQVTDYLRKVTRFLHHLGCPHYSESLLIQRPLRTQGLNREFITKLESRWVHDNRFGSEKVDIDANLYVLQVLHCLCGTPGISPFVGVVLDEESGTVKAFLTEFSTGGCIFDKITQSVSWQRREKWCRQIIQGVAAVHSKGFVVGCLGKILEAWIRFDGEDNALLSRFQTTFTYDHDSKGMLPPEYRRLDLVQGTLRALPETDIFQLGLLLWRIAGSLISELVFCETADCTAKDGRICTEPHADPIQLPRLGEGVPQYFEQVIAACRAENPDHRLTAYELLAMFPHQSKKLPLDEINHGALEQASAGTGNTLLEYREDEYMRLEESLGDRTMEKPSKQPANPEECQEIHGLRVFCDICGRPTLKHFFHCNICNFANYGICPQCYSHGAHCLDSTHYLREIFRGNSEVKYHSNLKKTGLRDVICI